MKYIKFTSYQGNYGFDQSMCQIDFASPRDNSEVLSLKMHTIGSTPIQIISPLKDASHDRSIKDMKEFFG
jgi:hypothetical protein